MIHKLFERVEQLALYQRLLYTLESIKLKNSQVSLYAIILIFFEKIRKQDIILRANGVAFNFTLALFPTILFLFTLLPYTNLPAAWLGFEGDLEALSSSEILLLLRQILPNSIYDASASTIEEIISRKRGDLLSFGFLFALYFSTNGMRALMRAFNRSYRTKEKRGFLRTLFIAAGLILILAFVLISAVILLIVGEQLLGILIDSGILKKDIIVYLLQFLRFMVLLLIFLIAISFIYYLAPSVHIRWRFFSVGSLLAAFLSIFVSFGFSIYINNFGTYNKLYGSIGALIAIMIWISFLSLIILLGFELNASIEKAGGYIRAKNIRKRRSLRNYFGKKKSPKNNA